MLESLVFALFKTFVVYMFDQQLRQQVAVEIEGAPQWYYQNKANHVCASGFVKGDFDALNQARERAQEALSVRIDNATKAMIYGQFSANTSPVEQELVKRFESDETLLQFVKANSRLHNVAYREAAGQAFARSCLDRQSLLAYEKARLDKIRVAVLEKYRHEAFDELESDQNVEGGSERDPLVITPPDPKGPLSVPSPRDPFLELEQERISH